MAFAATSLLIVSCKNNGNTKDNATSTEQTYSTATADSITTTTEEAKSEPQEVAIGDLPTFELVGNVKSCKWKNQDDEGNTVTYVFNNNKKLKTINGRKEDVSRNKKGQINGYRLGENGLTRYSFTYDAQGKMKTSEMYDADSGTNKYTYRYDAKGFVDSRYCKGEFSEMGADEPEIYEETVTYEYKVIDAQGNWTKRVCHGATGRDPWTETRTIVYY